MTELVRPATEADVPAVHRLAVEFHAFHVRGLPGRLRLPDPGADPPSRLDKALRAILEDPAGILLVADHGADVVGFAEASLHTEAATPFVVGGTIGHLQSLLVTEAARGQGHGRRLLDAAERWLHEQGATEIQTDAWEFDAGPLGFYEAAGYSTMRRRLAKPLAKRLR